MIGESLTGAEIFYRQSELAEASIVIAVGEQVAVRADGEGLHRHEWLALRHLVNVEQDFLGCVHAGFFAAADLVLLAGLGAHVIKVVAFLVRNLDVGLLHAAEHLVIELLLQRLGRLHHRVGVGVLFFQVSADFGIGFLAKPVVVVDHFVSIDLGFVRGFLGDRGCGDAIGCSDKERGERSHNQ